MHSHALIYILLAAAWIVFLVAVTAYQDRDQKRLQEPRVDEPAALPWL